MDIVDRVEKALEYEHVRIYGTDRLIRELVAELKAARAELLEVQQIRDSLARQLSNMKETIVQSACDTCGMIHCRCA